MEWHWTNEQQTSFNELKKLLISAPILRQADGTLPYTIKTDASAYAIGAILLQGEIPDEHPIEDFSLARSEIMLRLKENR